jgi:uncharacterized protein YjbI with pentapeptide repeats
MESVFRGRRAYPLIVGRITVGTSLLVLCFVVAAPTASAKSRAQKCNAHAGAHANLARCNLSAKSLRGLNLAYANLTDANLTGANVTGAKLGHAALSGVRTGRLHGRPASLPHGYRLVDGYLIGAGVSLVRADLGRINLSGVNLTSANLAGADLGRADLAATIVAGADFHDANLSHASLKDARDGAPEAGHAEKSLRGHADATADASVNLAGANLTDANLSGALLTNASMDGASLTGANLTQVDWQGADLSGLDLAGADLAGVDLANVNLTGTDLTGANLAGVSLTDVTATNATWTGANLAGVSFSAATVTGGNFTGTNLEGASFDGTVSGGVHGTPTNLTAGYDILDGYFVGPDVSLRSAPFSAADLHGMNLSGADLTKANLTGANLSGTNLADADLTDANLTGATVTGANTSGAISTGVIPAPTARNVSFSAAYETTLTVPTWYGLDYYASGLGSTVSLAQPANGKAVLSSGGSFTYLANPGFLGDDSLTYTVTDAFGRTASATVTVHVSMTGYIMQTLSLGPADMPGWEISGSWYGVVYDGSHLWAAATPSFVSEIDPSNGAGLGGFGPTEVLYGAGGQMGLATDGADIWVSGNVSTFQGDFSSVTDLSTSNPVSYGSVWADASAEQPGALAYGDGAVWVANPDGTVTELNASNGATIANYSACGAANASSDVAYSSGDVWVACSNFVAELDAIDGSLIGTYGLSTGAARYLTVSDGDVWVAGRGTGQNGTLTELSAATGAVIATQNLQDVAPTGILSDGTNIWVAAGNTLVGINASTGSVVLNDIGVNLADGVASMTFDGSHIWATTAAGGLVEIDDPVS